MKPATRKGILTIIIILGIVGLLTSIYLIESHYAPPTEGSLCDFGETVSCSVVNTSIYSELFNVSVAVFGAIWFVILFFMCRSALRKAKVASALMLGWSVIGVLFVLYMIVAEIILGALCPFCTVVHVIVVITLILSIILYKAEEKKLKKGALLKAAKPWLAAIAIINIIPIIVFNMPAGEDVNRDALAQCLTEKGMRMYGSYVCSGCRAQEKKFGDSFEYIDYVECHPRGQNPQTELCLKRGIPHTPAWILEKDGAEVKRLEGYQRLDTLAVFAGCAEGVVEAETGLPEGAPPQIQEMEQQLTWGIIITAALADSINPCIFGVLIFLLAYMTKVFKKNKKKMLLAGLIYIATVYATYLVLGLGILKLTDAVSGLAMPFYWFAAILAILAGLVEIKDYFWYGRWFTLQMLPGGAERVKRYAAIMEKLETDHPFLSVFIAVVLGFVVVLMELPCTGAPYLAILALVSKGELATAIPMLLIYNLIFVLPLFVIVGLVYIGHTSESLEKWRKEHRGLMRLGMGLFLIALGAYMLWSVI